MKSQSAYAGNHWIELRCSCIARVLRLVFYALILLSVALWSLPLAWQIAIYLLLLSCFTVDYLKDFYHSDSSVVDSIILSINRGVIATQKGTQVRKVRSFKIEHVLCYYTQLYLYYEDGGWLRLCIFPDSADNEALHKIRCVGVRYMAIQ